MASTAEHEMLQNIHDVKKILRQLEFRVECFEELLFTEGIATGGCYCFNAGDNEAIGFDEDTKSIVSIDLSDKLKRRLFHVDDGELKQAKWLRMLNTSSGTKKEFLILIITAEEQNEIIIRFKLSETGIIILNKVELNSQFKENETISLLQCAETKRNFYLKKRQIVEESKNTLINLIEIVLSTDGTMRLKSIYESLLLDYDFYVPTVHRDSLYLFKPTRLRSDSEVIPMANALLKVPLDNNGSNICDEFLYDLSSFKKRDSVTVSEVIGVMKNEIFYFLHTKASNSNILIGIDLNTFAVRQHFILNEHPVRTLCAFVSNNRIVINGHCTRCHNMHTYHFVINEELIPDCSLDLQEISAILSPRSKIVYCGEARFQMVLVWLIRQIFLDHFCKIDLYATRQKPYADELSRLPSILSDSVSLFYSESGTEILDPEIIIKKSCFVIDKLSEISVLNRMLLWAVDCKFLIILNNSMQSGFDHPNAEINWIGMKESSSVDNKRNEVDKTASIDLLDQYYPNWETSFENDHDTSTIIIPPYTDTEKTKMNNSESTLKEISQELQILQDKKILRQREFRVECFEELLFTEGIVTEGCYCFNAGDNEVIGFDEDTKSIVSIDLSDKLKRRLFHVDDEELKQASWFLMLNTSSGTKKEFLILIITAEKQNEIIIRFKLSETGIIILNKVELNSQYREENETISLLQCAVTKRNFYLKIRKVEEESKKTLISVFEIVLSTDGTMRLKSIYESLLLDYDFYFATVHRDSLYLFRWTPLFSDSARRMIPVANALLKVPLDNSVSNICVEFLYDLPSFKRGDSLAIGEVIGETKNEIFYFLHSEDSNSNILIGIDLNTFVVRQHFILNEHPVITYCAFVSNNRIVINGECTRPNCDNCHTYHFVINEELIPDCSLDLQEISAILSPRSKIVYCGEARIQMILVWLIRQKFLDHLCKIGLYVKGQKTYADELSRLPSIVSDSVSLFQNESGMEILGEKMIIEKSCFVIDKLSEISLSNRFLLSAVDCKFLIIFNNSKQSGYVHPNAKINWIGMKESSSVDMKRNEVDKTALIDPLTRYHPNWETSFENDHNTSIFRKSEFRVECFEELLFTEGIATGGCYCFNAGDNEAIGFDEDTKSIVSIDLSDKLKRRLFHVDDGELKQAKWLRMLNTSSGTKKEFLILIITAEEQNEIIIRFKLSETGIIILNKVELNSQFKENETISLLQCAETKRNFYLKKRQIAEESKNTLINLIEIVLSTDGTMRLKSIYESLLLDHDFYVATVHRDSLYLFRETRLFSDEAGETIPIAKALLKVPLDNYGPNICDEFLYDLPSFKKDNLPFVTEVIGGTKNEIFYFLHSEDSNSNILIGIDLNTFAVRQDFILNEHPVRTYCAFVSNNRIVINGHCTRCHNMHTYHFVINEELIPDCSLDLQEISAILSPRSKIVYCGEARLQMILLWLIRQIFIDRYCEIDLYVTRQKPYADELSRLPSIVSDSVSLFHNESDMEILGEKMIIEKSCFVIDKLSEISLSNRFLLSKVGCKFLIILNNSMQSGFDHPKAEINWIGMKESQSVDTRRNEVDQTASIHLLDRCYPAWERSFENDHNTSTIIIPPYTDAEKTKMNKSESGEKGRRAEQIFVEKFNRLRMGGILITNVGSKEFLKAHNASFDKKFEIDALFLHSKYGIITFECKAAAEIDIEYLLKATEEGTASQVDAKSLLRASKEEKKNKRKTKAASQIDEESLLKASKEGKKNKRKTKAASQIDEESLLKASKEGKKDKRSAYEQLQIVVEALGIAYRSSNKVKLNPIIHSVIIVPNAVWKDAEKASFKHKYHVSVWDKEDLEESKLRAKLFLIKENIARWANVTAPITNDIRMNNEKNFARITVASRSHHFVSPKLNAIAFYDQITLRRDLKPSSNDKKRSHNSTTLPQKSESETEKTKKTETETETKKTEKTMDNETKTEKKTTKTVEKKQKKPQFTLTYDDQQNKTVYLSPEQAEILNDDKHKIQIISGPPGSGKTLLMLLKVLQLDREGVFKDDIYASSDSEGSLLEIRQFFQLNLKNVKVNTMPRTEVLMNINDPRAAVFIDEVPSTSTIKVLEEIVTMRKKCSGPTFLCVTSGRFPGHLFRETVEQQLEQFSSDNDIICTFLSRIYRGTQNIINKWWPIYEKDSAIDFGHNIIGPEVEEYERDTTIELLEILVREIKELHSSSSFVKKERTICAVITEPRNRDFVRAFLASEGISCGTVLQHVQNPNLVAVDSASECHSMEWPAVFYFENEAGIFTERFRSIAYSRAIVKLVILKRNFIKIAELFEKILFENNLIITKINFEEFLEVLKCAEKRMCKKLTLDQVIFDTDYDIITILRNGYWPHELSRCLGFDCHHFYEAIDQLNENREARLKIVCAMAYFSEALESFASNIKTYGIRQSDDIPKNLVTFWKGQSCDVVKQRWLTCFEFSKKLFETLHDFLNCDNEEAKEKVKNEFGGDYEILKYMARIIVGLVRVCTQK